MTCIQKLHHHAHSLDPTDFDRNSKFITIFHKYNLHFLLACWIRLNLLLCKWTCIIMRLQSKCLPCAFSVWWVVGSVRSSFGTDHRHCTGSDHDRPVAREEYWWHRSWHIRVPLENEFEIWNWNLIKNEGKIVKSWHFISLTRYVAAIVSSIWFYSLISLLILEIQDRKLSV